MNNKIKKYLSSPNVTGLAQSTQDLYGYALKHWDEFNQKNTVIYDKKENFEAFVSYLENEKKVSGKTIQQYLTCIKIFLKWCGITVDFTYKISNEERKRVKVKAMERWFTELDISKCLNYASPNGKALLNKIIVRLLIETGCRVRELSFVKVKDIDTDDGIIWLHDSKTEPRPAFFSKETAGMIEKLRDSNIFWEDDVQVFPDVNAIKHSITKMLEELGLKSEKDGRGPHSFRHWTASHLFYSGGVRIEDIAFLMGDTVETVTKIYIHPTPLMLRERIAKGWGWEV